MSPDREQTDCSSPLATYTWYAIVGYTLQTPILTVSLLGPDWGGQRIGGPGDGNGSGERGQTPNTG